MISRKTFAIAATTLAIAVGAGGIAIATSIDHRTPVEFYKGHTHHDGITEGAPEHSGGTNSAGCHNASVPYHCH